MNRKNRHERHPLDLCPVCGMDSGERVQSTGAPFKHYVRCSSVKSTALDASRMICRSNWNGC